MAFLAPIPQDHLAIQPPKQDPSMLDRVLSVFNAPGIDALMGGPFGAVGSIIPRAASSAGGNYAKWFQQLGLRNEQEATGRAVLDGLENAGRNPRQVVDDFWKGAYNALTSDAQGRFHQYIQKLTGFEPGSVIAVDGNRNPITANNWMDVYPASQVPTAVDHLEGTERGLISLMEMANARHAVNANKPALKQLPSK